MVTPNRFEAAQLSQMDDVLDVSDMEQAARALFDRYHCSTLITGGGLGDELIDVYAGMDGISHFRATARKKSGNIIGVGCTFAAALTALLARGESLRECILAGKDYVAEQITTTPVMNAHPEPHAPICHCMVTDHLAHADGFGVGCDTGRFQIAPSE